MDLRINSCGINYCQPDWKWITHQSGFPDYDIWAIFHGKGYIFSPNNENEKYHVAEGDALLLAPNTQYIAEHEIDNPLLVINIHFDFLDENGHPIYPCGILAKHITDITFFRTILTRVVTLFNGNQEKCANAFLAAALSEYSISDNLLDNINTEPWHNIIREITYQIETAKKIPSLAQFAAHYGYSERYVGKMFNTINGISFSEYTKNTKISKAKTLLRNTSISIAEIAEELGFYDPCHFSKTFHSEVGASPFSYRSNK